MSSDHWLLGDSAINAIEKIFKNTESVQTTDGWSRLLAASEWGGRPKQTNQQWQQRMIHFYLQTLVITHLSVFLVCILQVLARLGLTPVSPTKATVHRVPSAHTSQTSGRSSASRVLPASPPTSGELPARTSVSVSLVSQRYSSSSSSFSPFSCVLC